MTDPNLPSPAVETTTPEPRRRRRRYNWPRLKAEYVEGITGTDGKVYWPSFSEVAERNHALSQNLRTRAAKEGWTGERAQFQRRIESQRQNERSTELAALGADLDVSALRVARNGLAVTAARMQELGRDATLRAEAIRQAGGRTTTPGTPPAPDSDELATLARAANSWYELGTRALGDVPTARLEVDLDVDVTATLDSSQRDSATLAVMAILQEARLITDGTVDTRDVLDVGGGPALDVGVGGDPETQQVPAADPDDVGEREPEAARLPDARSA